MKKVLLLVLCLSFVIISVNAKQMQPDHAKIALESPGQGKLISSNRYLPDYSFTKTPTVLLESYYDYMIGSYNSIPIRNIPLAEGGYFITFHGKRTPSGARRVFYAHLNAAGQISNINEISQVTNHEGYPSMAVDPVSGKPLYAWHANADADAELEIQFTSDAYMYDLSGLFNEIIVAVDNPRTVMTSNDNEFIWPTVQIGPSPVDGMRRAYVAGRNSVTHHSTANPTENLIIAYADFNGDMIESGADLVWTYTSIPELDQWNHGVGEFRRPNCALITDELGNVYYAGYHISNGVDDTDLFEPNLDVFMCPNYGAGTWTRVSTAGKVDAWDPLFPDGTHAFNPEGEFFWDVINSSHLNAVVSSDGKIIVPILYGLQGAGNTYYPAYQTVKATIYDTATQEFSLTEIYPQKDPEDTFNPFFMPWDTEAPWGVAEYVLEGGTYYAVSETIYPFPHWDRELHDGSMEFHCGNLKVSEPNADGLMVAVWQDSYRAQLYNMYPESYPELAAFVNTPEVYISASSDNGLKWSEPIVLNNVETPAFAGLKPMWVYPADKVISTGTTPEGNKIGKIGFLLYNDYTWGANAVAPPAHSVNDGGAVMFMEMQIEFPPPVSNNDNIAPQITSMLNQNYPNPFNPETNISFDMPANGNAKLEIYNVKGQLVKSLFDGAAPFGRTSLVWNGTDNSGQTVTSGLYFYRLSTDNHSETRKMMLMK
ncbi:MAG: T9SS type A sorting domain-containing protein [Candidatus Cloacimonadaceae bacterium]|nr:T9SS type A sorting domain-containing protein [Candidatus Cloacimonadaceae bacterium]